MMKDILICFSLSLALSIISERALIFLLKRKSIGQPILSYVEEHKAKSGTPTMGGLAFVAAAIAAYFIVYGFESVYAVFGCALFAVFALIGFSDDFIKIKFSRNEGLKPWQKTAFLFIASMIVGVFMIRQGQSAIYLPFSTKRADIGFLIFPLAVFAVIAASNCVNLTDGLDGLASSVSATYFIFCACIIALQISNYKSFYVKTDEMQGLIGLSVATAAALLGFLVFNVNKASVFMGDTGSLALGALCAYILLASGNALYIPILGVTFVLSGVSVIIQVLHYKRTKRRVFLMAPLHHHFQHKGYSEAKIAYVYVLITIFAGILCLCAYI